MSLFSRFNLGRHIPGESIIHRLDPRAKVLACALATACSFAHGSLSAVMMSWPLLAAGIYLSTIGAAEFAKGLSPLKWVVLAGVTMHAVSTPGTPLWPTPLFGIEWSVEGVQNGLRVMGQLVTAVAFATLLTLTTAPDELAWALEKLTSPLKRLGLPVEEFFLCVTLALGFFPILSAELDQIASKGEKRSKLNFAEQVVGRMLKHAKKLEEELTAKLTVQPRRVFKLPDLAALGASALTLWAVLGAGAVSSVSG